MRRMLMVFAGVVWLGTAAFLAVVIGRAIKLSRGPDGAVSTAPEQELSPLLGVVPPPREMVL